jgi:hypothetical protein
MPRGEEGRKMALRDLVEREIVDEIRGLALWAVMELKLHKAQYGKSLLDTIYVEYGWWEGQHLNRAQTRRFRCLEAISMILNPLLTTEMTAGEYILGMDRAADILRHVDVLKVAPAPDVNLLHAFRMKNESAFDAINDRLMHR